MLLVTFCLYKLVLYRILLYGGVLRYILPWPKLKLWCYCRSAQKVTSGASAVFCTRSCTAERRLSRFACHCWSCKRSWILLTRLSFRRLGTLMLSTSWRWTVATVEFVVVNVKNIENSLKWCAGCFVQLLKIQKDASAGSFQLVIFSSTTHHYNISVCF